MLYVYGCFFIYEYTKSITQHIMLSRIENRSYCSLAINPVLYTVNFLLTDGLNTVHSTTVGPK